MIKILRTADNKILRTSANVVLRRFIQEYFPVAFGLLYNYYAVKDTRKISSSDDWVVPAFTDYQTLRDYLGGVTVAGGKLKSTGLTYWNSPNTGATNEANFNSRGAGGRSSTGGYNSIKTKDDQSVLYETGGSSILFGIASYSSDDFGGTVSRNFKEGSPVRLLYVGSGSPTLYTGNDGKVYPVVLIGSQYWIAYNLAETRFRNNDIIPWYGAVEADFFTSSEWAALTTAGCCAYNNDVANVGEGFSFPT